MDTVIHGLKEKGYYEFLICFVYMSRYWWWFTGRTQTGLPSTSLMTEWAHLLCYCVSYNTESLSLDHSSNVCRECHAPCTL